MNKNNAHIIRNANRYNMLMTLLEHPKLTIEELVRITDLSRPTVLGILKDLINERLVVQSGKIPSEVGRQPFTFEINNEHLFAMGLDIDFPDSHLAISNLSGEMIYSTSKYIASSLSAKEITEEICCVIEQAIVESKISRSDIIGIGIGMPAIVDAQRNLALRISKVPSWQNIDLASIIQSKCKIYAFIRNDAHLLGLIERKYRGLKDRSFLYVTHRSGVGSSIFINGELYDGGFGNSGYIGHNCIDINGPSCECGNKGCLELYCSKRAIVKNYNEQAIKTGNSCCLTSEEVFERCRYGDVIAASVLSEAGRILGIGIANLCLLYDINYVILGWVKNIENPFFENLVKAIDQQRHTFMETGEVIVELGVSDEVNSGMAGCYFILSQFFQAPTIELYD